MSRIETGGPAFPRPVSEDTTQGTQSDGNRTEEAQDGMTLRDWFAGQALVMAGVYRLTDSDDPSDKTAAFIAEKAYGIADAMLAARGK